MTPNSAHPKPLNKEKTLKTSLLTAALLCALALAAGHYPASAQTPQSTQPFLASVAEVCDRILPLSADEAMRWACSRGYLQGQAVPAPAVPFRDADADTKRETLKEYLALAAEAVTTSDWQEHPTDFQVKAFIDGYLVAALGGPAAQ